MSKKSELKKKIEETESDIEALEAKLMRSQISVISALMDKKDPSETDKEYFRVYSKLIEVERDNLQELYRQLNNL